MLAAQGKGKPFLGTNGSRGRNSDRIDRELGHASAEV